MVPSMAAFFSFLLLFPLLPSAITLPLQQHLLQPTSFTSPYQNLNSLVNSSINRAHQIKHPRNSAAALASDFTAKTELAPHSYGGYSVSLSFGTPPQGRPFPSSSTLPAASSGSPALLITSASTASSIPQFLESRPLFRCSRRLPRSSAAETLNAPGSTAAAEQCGNCGYGGGRGGWRSRYCSQICPPYLILYGSGTTGGVALSETLQFQNLKVPNFPSRARRP